MRSDQFVASLFDDQPVLVDITSTKPIKFPYLRLPAVLELRKNTQTVNKEYRMQDKQHAAQYSPLTAAMSLLVPIKGGSISSMQTLGRRYIQRGYAMA